MNEHSRRGIFFTRTGAAALLLLCAGLALRATAPPAALGESAAPEAFSAGRALEDVRALAAAPRPAGSAAHDRAREHIVARLEALGLAPQVQHALAQSPQRVAWVDNVVARVPGSAGGGPALLLCAHYDSVPTSFGAGDNAAAVAALIETARVLRLGPPLARDVVLLFTDGEEYGLLGARAFLAQHPWARDVAAVLNFDARGTRGPVVAIPSGGAGAAMVAALGAVPDALSSSLFLALYEQQPNATDFDVFREAGVSGINFAFVGDLEHYHSLLDDASRLDARTLQHIGAYALGLTRSLGSSVAAPAAGAPGTFFTLPGVGLLRQPAAWTLPLLFTALLAFVALVGREVSRRRLAPGRVLLAWLGMLITLALAGAATGVAWAAALALRPEMRRVPWGQPYNAEAYAAAFAVLGLGLAGTACSALCRRYGARAALAAGLLTLLAGAAVAAFALPGAAYLFLWPLLFGLAGFATFVSRGRGDLSASALAGASLSSALPALLLLVPPAYLMLTGLHIVYAPVAVALFAAPLGWLVAPAFAAARPRRAWLGPLLALLPCLLVPAWGGAGQDSDGRTTLSDSLFYGLDADSGEAYWMSTDRRSDAWTGRYLTAEARQAPMPQFFAGSRDDVLLAPAPSVAVGLPEALLESDERRDGVRTVGLRVRSTRGASDLLLHVPPPAEVAAAQIDGVPLSALGGRGDSGWSLRCLAVGEAGLRLTLDLRSSGPLRLLVVDTSFGLPAPPGSPSPTRPAGLIPRAFGSGISDLTMVARSFTFAPPASPAAPAEARP